MTPETSQHSPSTSPVGGLLPALTDAELRIARESLGLTAEQVADRLGVVLRTVRRWEAGDQTVPAGVADEVGRWVEAQEAQITAWVDRLLDEGDPVVVIPRAGVRDGWPASWWRATVGRVVEDVPGLRVVYAEDEGS